MTLQIKATNLGPAYARTFTDIPYSQQIAAYVGAERNAMQTGTKIDFIVPYMEARYKAIDFLVQKAGVGQVVEIAAGWSPRGMMMSADKWYIETDQDPVEIGQKEEMVKTVLGARPSGLHIMPLDAVTCTGLSALCRHMRPQRTAVIHEGLFRYLTHDQKGYVMDCARTMLVNGGVYITPDIHTRTRLEKLPNAAATIKAADKRHSAMTGTDIEANYFADEKEAQALFELHGFHATWHKIGDLVKDLSCVNHPGLDKTVLQQSVAIALERTIWEMTPQ